MSIKSLHTLIKSVAILLWLDFAVTIVALILNHSFWSMMPIIAHNYPQNWLGWELTIAVILSFCSSILKLIMRNN